MKNIENQAKQELTEFLQIRTATVYGAVTLSAELIEAYNQWATNQGKIPWTMGALHSEMKTRGYQIKRRQEGMGYAHLELKQT